MKNYLKRGIAVILCLVLVYALTGCTGSHNNDTPNTTLNPTSDVENTQNENCFTCTITIDATTAYKSPVLDEAVRNELKNEGMLLNKASMSSGIQQTVTDLFTTACSLSDIVVDIESGQYGSFIKGIGGLYNGDCGENSYWLLRINGEYPEVGADSITVKNGDEIVWIYTCDGGADIGYNWQSE